MVRSNCFHVKVCMLTSPLYGSIKLCLVVYRQHIVTQKKPPNSPPFDFSQIDILTTKQFSLKVLRVLLLNPPFTNLPEWVVITSHLKKMHQKKILMWNGLWLCGWNLARIKAFCSLMHECIWSIVNRYYDLSLYIIENLEP